MSNIVNEEDFLIVMTTMPDDERAEALAEALVAARLAACVNVQAPMRSVYRWKGAIERDSERQIVIKTTRRRLAALEARVRSLHPYELPEWVVLSAGAISEGYLRWARDETGDAAGTR